MPDGIENPNLCWRCTDADCDNCNQGCGHHYDSADHDWLRKETNDCE